MLKVPIGNSGTHKFDYGDKFECGFIEKPPPTTSYERFTVMGAPFPGLFSVTGVSFLFGHPSPKVLLDLRSSAKVCLETPG